jgi:hypothetical protein
MLPIKSKNFHKSSYDANEKHSINFFIRCQLNYSSSQRHICPSDPQHMSPIPGPTAQLGQSVAEMTSYRLVACLTLLLAVSLPSSSAGFGSNLINGFNRFVSKVTGSGNNTAAAATGSGNNTAAAATGSGNNTAAAATGSGNNTAVCPPPRPHLEVTLSLSLSLSP